MIPLFGTAVIICLTAMMTGVLTDGPPDTDRRRPTGIIGLNLLLNGGFPQGTIIMVHGTALAGVDLAARHFCNSHPEETGSYLVPEDIIDQQPPDAKMNPDMYLSRMTGERIVIDSLSAMIERYGIDQTLYLLALAKNGIRERGANLMFIVYTGIHMPMDMTKLMRAADIVIEFKTNIRQSEIERTLCVQKIKNTAAPLRLLPFIITEHGIEASTTSRVV
jgi:KaiC/GvpD/RAD55 family RecA-like ATPase